MKCEQQLKIKNEVKNMTNISERETRKIREPYEDFFVENQTLAAGMSADMAALAAKWKRAGNKQQDNLDRLTCYLEKEEVAARRDDSTLNMGLLIDFMMEFLMSNPKYNDLRLSHGIALLRIQATLLCHNNWKE
jgi:hypothetical protein